jgi:hypothetical protein
MSVTQNDLLRFRSVSSNCVAASTNAFFLLLSPTCDQLVLDDPAAAVQRIEAELATMRRIDSEWKTLAEKCYETLLLATCHLEPLDDFHRTAHEAADYHMTTWLRAAGIEPFKPSTASLRKWFELVKEFDVGFPSKTWGLPERINREYALAVEYLRCNPQQARCSYLGEGTVRLDGRMIRLNEAERRFVEALLDHHCGWGELSKKVNNPSVTFKEIRRKLGEHVWKNPGKGEGYGHDIHDGRRPVLPDTYQKN